MIKRMSSRAKRVTSQKHARLREALEVVRVMACSNARSFAPKAFGTQDDNRVAMITFS